MKKFFSMLLALVMLLALAGCGGNDKTPAQDQGGSSDAGQTQQDGDSGEAGRRRRHPGGRYRRLPHRHCHRLRLPVRG